MSKTITPDELYQNYSGKVERYVSAHVQNVHDRADVVQQVFLNAISAMDSYDSERSAPGTWLYAIARNAVIDYYRRQSREPLAAELEELTLTSPRADEQILTQETMEALAGALEKLPERERNILIFRFYHGLSAQETAKRVGVSYANVRFLQNRALKKMRGYLCETGYVR